MTIQQIAQQIIEYMFVSIAIFGLLLMFTIYRLYQFWKWLNKEPYEPMVWGKSKFGKRVS